MGPESEECEFGTAIRYEFRNRKSTKFDPVYVSYTCTETKFMDRDGAAGTAEAAGMSAAGSPGGMHEAGGTDGTRGRVGRSCRKSGGRIGLGVGLASLHHREVPFRFASVHLFN